jgi:hypothetical protein
MRGLFKQVLELRIGVIAQFVGHNLPGPGQKWQLAGCQNILDLIKSEERSGDVMSGVSKVRAFRCRARGRQKQMRGCPRQKTGDEAGTLAVIDTENPQLLEDERNLPACGLRGTDERLAGSTGLDAVPRHQAHGSFNWLQMAEGGELIQQCPTNPIC